MNCLMHRHVLLCALCAIVVAGCAHELPPPQAVPQPPPLTEASMQSSTHFEQKGELTAAVERLKIALTLDPHNKKAREEMIRLQEKRDREAEKRYVAGQALAGSDPAAARREFLAALRIRSDYPEALAAIKDLQLGSSEATLKARAKKESAASARASAATQEEEYETEVSSLDSGIANYEEGNYTEAIRDLQKARARSPNDPEIGKYLNLSWYNSGVTLYNRKEYRKSLEAFTHVRKGFEKVEDYIRKTRQALKNVAEEFYKQGLKFFREQKLQEAIARWNSVLEIEPAHLKAKEYLEKARKLLEALKQQR